MFGGGIVCLREILVQIIEFPLIILGGVARGPFGHFPRLAARHRIREPVVVIDTAIADKLELLPVFPPRYPGRSESVVYRDNFRLPSRDETALFSAIIVLRVHYRRFTAEVPHA